MSLACVKRSHVSLWTGTRVLPLSGNGVRQATVTSTEQRSGQNTTWYSRLRGKLLILLNAQRRMSTKLHGATTLRIIISKGYSPVSEYKAVWSKYYIFLVISACLCTRRHTVNSGNGKETKGLWKQLFLFPSPCPLLYSYLHVFYYTRQPTPQVLTVISLVRYQVKKPQIYSLQ
jgi:hypothetical protein